MDNEWEPCAVDATFSGPERSYEAPVLRVVGNLADLLAGSGTQLADDQSACGGGNQGPC
jgi:hypothetical protein